MNKQKPNIGATREAVYEYTQAKYGTMPEHLWLAYPLYSVFRRADNNKWYAIVMNISKSKLGLKSQEIIDILVIKCDPIIRDFLLESKIALPAYHMNRENWITVLLDGTVDIESVNKLLDESYRLAERKTKKTTRLEPTCWLIPANPKYYDLEKAFNEDDVLLWKQSNSIIAGDTIYIYIGAPFSCIMYRCVVLEVNIPYEYNDGKLRMNNVMKIKRQYTFDRGAFGIKLLQEHGVYSVRGARSIPFSLNHKLEKESRQ